MRIAILFVFIITISHHPPLMQGTYCDYSKEKFNSDRAYHILDIHYSNSGKLYFYLEAGRGAPDYNSGAMYRELTYNSKWGNYEYLPKNLTEDCKLIFIRKKNSIVIKTALGDCQFGYGVDADATYLLRNSNNPMYFIDRHNHKIYFEITSPEKYLE